MGLLDFLRKKDVPAVKELTIKHGSTGTQITGGMIDEEYNKDLVFPESIKIYDEMRKSDGTCAAVLRAIKAPLLSAEWQVQSGGKDDRDKEISAFVEKNLFEKINFQIWLKEALGYLDFGFKYFEKVFEVKDGMIEWKEFAPRIPRAHYEWGIKGQDWVDGHPAGVTQCVNTTDESGKMQTLYPTIPWGKLILFSNDREGNNYEGVSILRPAYKHYFYKDLVYRIGSVSAERYGVGTPVATVKGTMNTANQTKVENFLKNLRSNEKSFGLLTEEVVKMEIMTPGGTGVNQLIKDIVDHHDKKIYDAILAGFLNLTSGEGGSNALSKDQSSFFLRGLQEVADYIIDVLNAHIRELVDLNFVDVEYYPTLMVSEIGQTSMDENISAISTAVQAGMIELNDDDKNAIRAVLKLPIPSMADEDDALIAEVESDLRLEKLEVDTMEDFGGMNSEVEDNGADITEDEKEMCDEVACLILSEGDIELGQPLTEEHKRKISEALQKNLQGPLKDVSLPSTGDMFGNDSKIGEYQRAKENLKRGIEALSASISEIKGKRTSMSKVEKKKFAATYKMKIEEMSKQRKELQAEAKRIGVQEKNRKDTVRSIAKEARNWLKSKKKEERDQIKSNREAAKLEKKIAKEKKLAEGDKKKVPSKREVTFTRFITDFEKYLEGKMSEVVGLVEEAEKNITEGLVELYKGSETEMFDGVVCLKYDKTKITEGKNLVKKITAGLEKKLIDGKIKKEVFDEAIVWAKNTLEKNDEMLLSWSLDVKQSQINTFIEGYVSNMQGVIFNESRRVLENITLNYGSETALEAAVKTAEEIRFNRNILNLSFITHPRALYKYVIYDEAQGEGFTLFKTIVPANKIENVKERPQGITAGIIYTILTAAQINAYAAKTTEDKTAEAVAGLGLHHGSFEYYYPIVSTELDEEKEVAKIQREELFNS